MSVAFIPEFFAGQSNDNEVSKIIKILKLSIMLFFNQYYKILNKALGEY